MSLILIDGFDLYSSTNDFVRTWSRWNAPSGLTSNPVRTGRLSWYANNSTERTLRDFLPAEEHVTVIVGMGIYRSGADDTAFIEIDSDGGGTNHVQICADNLGTLRATRGPRTGITLATSAAGVFTPSVWHYLEAKITLSDTVGAVVVRLDGIERINVSGQDTKNAGTKTTIDSVGVGQVSSAGGVDCFVDDVYICNGAGTTSNDFLGECRVRTLYPNGNGANSFGTGSDGNNVNNYQLVLDTTPSTGGASYVDLANTNDEDTYTFDDLPDIVGNVAGVQISSYTFKTDSGVRSLAHLSRVSGTDYASADMVLGTSYGWYRTILDQNPATGAAWLRNELNAAEFGVRARP